MKLRFLPLLLLGLSSTVALADNLGSETFESYDVGLTISNLVENGATWSSLGSWKAGVADQSKIAANENGNKYLNFKTEGDVITNEFASADNINSLAENGDIIVFESEMQFIPCDEIDVESYPSSPEGNGSMKFALYAYTNGDDPADAKTSLVLYHSYYDLEKESIACVNDILMPVDDNAALSLDDPENKHSIRVELKKFNSDRSIFRIFIDNYAMCATNGIIRGAQTLVPPDTDLIKNRTWFGTANATGRKEISALNLSGSGAIDNINLTSASPEGFPSATVAWDTSAFIGGTTENPEKVKGYDVSLNADFSEGIVNGNSTTLADGGAIYVKLWDNTDYHFAGSTTTKGLVFESGTYAIYTYEYSDSMVTDDDGTVHVNLDITLHKGDKATCIDCGYIPPDYEVTWTVTDGTCYDGDTLLTSTSTTFGYGTTKTLTFRANGDLIVGFASLNGNQISFEPNSTSISIDVTESSTIIVRFKERPKESFAENDVVYESNGNSVTLTGPQAEWLDAIRKAGGLTYEEVTERIAGENDSYSFEQEYLLNTSPIADTDVIFQVSDISVTEDGIDVEITLSRMEDNVELDNNINGTLKLATGSGPSDAFAKKLTVEFDVPTSSENAAFRQSFSSADSFFKAIIE